MDLNVMSIIKNSNVNGPGNRYVLWVQGCGKGCPNCFNPESWSYKKNKIMDTDDIVKDILESNSDGLTLSGGDPLEYAEPIYDILTKLHNADGSLTDKLPQGIICFTGFTVEELEEMTDRNAEYARKCRPLLDLLIDGRFVQALKHEHTLSGSSNQRLWWSEKEGRGKAIIDENKVNETFDHEVEIHEMDNDGIIQITGFPAIDRKWLKEMGIYVQK